MGHLFGWGVGGRERVEWIRCLMRALFLDFDGVLMPCPPRAGVLAFAWLADLQQLLDPHPDVCIVLHTSWRWHQTVEHMSSFLGSLEPRVIGATARGQRYETILMWLDEHPASSYVILDDQPGEYPTPAPQELILCDGRLGITDPQARERLRVWLETPESHSAVTVHVEVGRGQPLDG